MDNQVIVILKTVIKQYGLSVLTDVKRCRALLTDHCCGAYAREVKLLLIALEEGIATDLQHPPAGLPESLLHSRLVDRMVTERYLDRTAANWVVCAWRDAGVVSLPTVVIVPEKVTIQTPETSNIANTYTKTVNERLIQLGIELINIPTGDFLHGVQKEKKTLPAFYIMKTPVTVAQYRQFCETTIHPMPTPPKWGWQDTHPIVNVSFHDATAFSKWVGLALPTEIEWEKAARGTDGRDYPWGNKWDISKCCNSVRKSAGQTYPVGNYPDGNSPYGVQDMSGNVEEWCDNCYGRNSTWVLRGGSWGYVSQAYFRVTCQNRKYSDFKSIYCGFRCVLRSLSL